MKKYYLILGSLFEISLVEKMHDMDTGCLARYNLQLWNQTQVVCKIFCKYINLDYL